MSVNRSCLAVLMPALAMAAAQAAAPPADSISGLREQLQRQQAVIESQEARLAEQERLLRELAARLGQPLPAPLAVAAAPASPAPLPAPPSQPAETAAEQTVPKPLWTRFNDLNVAMAGALRTTVTTTNARMQPDATPFLVLPKINGLPEGTTKIDARLSSLLFSISGGQVGDYQLGGMIYAYLFNGDLLSGLYGFYPGFAYVEAKSDTWRFSAGLQQDVFSPMMPTMVDRMSAFAGSGNPGNSFKPQLRVERYFQSGDERFVFEGALADAMPSNIKPSFVGSTENTGAPNAEARFAWTHGSARDDGALLDWPQYTLGVSATTGRFRTIYSPANGGIAAQTTRLRGVALEAGWRISQRLGLQGELYTGRALGSYLATAFQTVDSGTLNPIRGSGGWGELAWYWAPGLHSHVGYGRDSTHSADHSSGIRSNATAFTNLFWDPSPKTTLAIEATWRRTDFLGVGAHEGLALMLSSELRF